MWPLNAEAVNIHKLHEANGKKGPNFKLKQIKMFNAYLPLLEETALIFAVWKLGMYFN